MTEFGQEVVVPSLSVEAALVEARTELARHHVEAERTADLEAIGRTVSRSLGYLERLFAPEDIGDVTAADRLVDMYISFTALGLTERADAAKQLLKGVCAEPKLTHRLDGEISHFMGVEKQTFGKHDNPRWNLLHTAQRQLRHADVLTGRGQVLKTLRTKIGAVAGRLSLRDSVS